MEKIRFVKDGLCLAVGTAGGLISAAVGGWSGALTTLIIFMAIDYITGLVVAGVFHRSEKTPDGTLESRAGWKGLIRKGMSLLVVLIACRLDLLIGTHIIRDSVVIAFVVNEVISITENAGLMGVPIPKIITSAIHVLKEEADKGPVQIEKLSGDKEGDQDDDAV
jgi:toxin secretion/phage lysis holin